MHPGMPGTQNPRLPESGASGSRSGKDLGAELVSSSHAGSSTSVGLARSTTLNTSNGHTASAPSGSTAPRRRDNGRHAQGHGNGLLGHGFTVKRAVKTFVVGDGRPSALRTTDKTEGPHRPMEMASTKPSNVDLQPSTAPSPQLQAHTSSRPTKESEPTRLPPVLPQAPAPSLPTTPALSSPSASSPLTPVGVVSDAPSPASTTFPSAQNQVKGKGKARAEPERRVLPARIRRAVGGGVEGVRELEEMIVDWLTRFSDIDTEPPSSLAIYLTTLPLALVSPAPYVVEPEGIHGQGAEPDPPKLPPTATNAPEAGPSSAQQALIETPSWVLVNAGEDDQMEAREEISAGPNRSPSKRLRHIVIGNDRLEDTSDAHYEQVHRRLEAFERRQRIREREKLQFERHKMRTRVELLRNLPAAQWGTVVNTILSRSVANDAWARGKQKLNTMGVDWLRRRLIHEGMELLRRYDQLLPSANDNKRQRLMEVSRMSSPSMASSSSPPPSVPHVEEHHRKRPRVRATLSTDATPVSRPPSRPLPTRAQPPVKRTYGRRNRIDPVTPAPDSPETSLSDPESSPPASPPPQPNTRLRIRLPALSQLRSATPPSKEEVASQKASVAKPSPAQASPARRRQRSMREPLPSSPLVHSVDTLGLSLTAAVEAKHFNEEEFSLPNVEGLWPLMAERERAAKHPRLPNGAGKLGLEIGTSFTQQDLPNSFVRGPHVRLADSGPPSNDTEDEMRDMEGVEASVLTTDDSQSL